jgi:hypothetical protein
MGDDDSITVMEHLTQQLLEHQIDFDYLDEQVLTTVGTLDGGGLKNLSGQVYRGIVIPSSTVITRAALDRLRAFAAQGGKVIFVGRTPTQVIERTFMKPVGGAPDLSFAVLEPAAEITARVIEALPKPDVALDPALPSRITIEASRTLRCTSSSTRETRSRRALRFWLEAASRRCGTPARERFTRLPAPPWGMGPWPCLSHLTPMRRN